MTVLYNAIKRLRPNVNFGIGNEDDWDTIQMSDGSVRPTDSEINSVLQQSRQDTALSILREKRNQLLAQTDWMAVSDRTMTQTQIDYRQALRDITTQAPSLDSDGNLTGITWPTPPTD